MCSKMIFDNPDPEDLSFDFSLENTGCVITVRNYRDFNDDSAKKLFPRSSADYVPSATYTIPDSYFSESFWNTERERLRRVLNVWVSNKSKLIAAVPSEKTDDLKFVDCMARVVAVIDMYEWMLDACWDGDRSKPPIPLYLYRARLSELKDANSLGIQYLHDFFCDEKHIGKHEGDPEISDVRSAPQWEVALMEHIDEVLIALDKIANAGEYVEEAFEIAVEIRKCLVEGKSCSEDLSAKLKFLNETVMLLEKKVTERTNVSTARIQSSVSNGDNCSNGIVKLSNRGRRSTGAKRGRRSTKLGKDGDYVKKRRSLGSITRDPADGLISRVKRGQRTRRPARAFTPLWTLSPSPPPVPKTALSSKASPSVRRLSSLVMKRTSSPSTSSAPGLLSPDSGRPSSNESSGNTTTAVIEKQLSCDAQHKDSAAGLKQCGVTQAVQSPTSESLLLPPSSSLATASSSVQTIVPSTSFSTPTTTLSIPKVSPPPLNIDEQSLLALLKEKIQLGDVRITLLNMLATDGTSHYHFIPLMVETIDKATAALDNKDMIAYTMHRAAIEVGCTELGNIMRLCNPVDPTSQIATLAAAMGLNPAPFTTMIQPSAVTNGLSSDVLVDLHEAATVVAAREKLTGSYTLPSQTAEAFPGYVERDITKYLL